MKQEKPITDLDWKAFLYVADEMEAADRDAFEIRLSDDQKAREAVANAVTLGQAMHQGLAAGLAVTSEQSFDQQPSKVSVANRTMNRDDSRSHPRIGTWAQFVAIASILCLGIFGIQWLQPPTQHPVDAARSLAVVWAETVAGEETDLDEVEYESDEEDALIDIQDVGWMTVALSEMESIDLGVNE